jgi:hypothetical protein
MGGPSGGVPRLLQSSAQRVALRHRSGAVPKAKRRAALKEKERKARPVARRGAASTRRRLPPDLNTTTPLYGAHVVGASASATYRTMSSRTYRISSSKSLRLGPLAHRHETPCPVGAGQSEGRAREVG